MVGSKQSGVEHESVEAWGCYEEDKEYSFVKSWPSFTKENLCKW